MALTWIELLEHCIFVFFLLCLTHGMGILSLRLDVGVHLVIYHIFCDLRKKDMCYIMNS